MKIVYISAAL